MKKEGKMKVVKVFIAIPNEGRTEPEAYNNRLDMFYHLGRLQEFGIQADAQGSDGVRFEFIHGTIGRVLTPKAREELAKIALEQKVDYLFMIDDDMLCPDNLFEKLYAHDVDIVAPLAFMRRAPYYPVCYIQRKGYDKVRKASFIGNEIVKNYPKNKLFEVDAVGFGAVLIKRWVLEKMQPPRFMSTEATGEDILFCYNAKERVGARVFMDTATEILHLGSPKVIGEKDFEEVNDMKKIRKDNPEYKHEYNKEESQMNSLHGGGIYVQD